MSKDGNYESVPLRGNVSEAGILRRAIAVGDVNNDGLLDVVFEIYGSDTHWDRPTPEESATTSIVIGDLDEDGRLDIVIGYQRSQSTSGANEVFYQEEEGNFTAYDLPGDESTTNEILIETSS